MQKGSIVTFILIGILVLVGVVAGAYYFGKVSTKSPQYSLGVAEPDAKNLNDQSKKVIEEKTVETTKPDSIGANWKTYINSIRGYSLEYPNNWNQIILTDKNSDYLPGMLLTPQLQKSLAEGKVENVPGVYIYTREIKECTDSVDFVQKEINMYVDNSDLYPNLKIRKLNSNTINGYIIDEGAPGVEAQKGPEVFIFQCPVEIQISFDPKGIENNQQIFDQILSTFKFIP